MRPTTQQLLSACLLVVSVLPLSEAWSAQLLEVAVDDAVVLAEPKEEAVVLESPARGELYQASDRSYQGFFKVLLKSGTEETRHGWILEDWVRSAPQDVATATQKGVRPLELALLSLELGYSLSTYQPVGLQEALGIPEASSLGGGFTAGLSIRLGERWRWMLQGATFRVGPQGTAAANFSISGTEFSSFVDFDVLQAGSLAASIALGGGLRMGSIQTVSLDDGTLVNNTYRPGFWHPRAGVRWNFSGRWSAHLRGGRLFAAESRHPLAAGAAFVNTSGWIFQLALSHAFF